MKEKKVKEAPRQIEDILANSADKSKLLAFLNEAVVAKGKIAIENDAIKSLREDAAETIGIQPKLFNQLLRVAFNNSSIETKSEISALESAIEVLFESQDGQ